MSDCRHGAEMCDQCLDILADGIQQGRDEMRAELAEEQDDDVITTTTDTIQLVWNEGYEAGRNTMLKDVRQLLVTYGPLNSVIPEIMKLLDRELS